MLKELIDENKIAFIDKVNNWEESIILSAKPLLEDNYIEKKYIHKVIENVKKLGPYIVIAPKIAISHARPEEGVNRLGMSILIIKEAVNFSEDKDRKVNIVITLAAPDNEKHLLALQQLSELLMASLDELLAAKDKKTILDLIKKYSKKEE
ncbi:MAG: PTS sugar transporter subunit IIA [Candidatus Izimaplasma sp.]|nr:PTS sugar transporter subunit IIA [Candidatus Izimaplasma bacterium]